MTGDAVRQVFLRARVSFTSHKAMKDLADLALSQIPKYVSNFTSLVASPIQFIRSFNPYKDSALSEAFVFLGISLIITFILKAPLLPAPDKVNTFAYIAADGVWKVTMVAIVAASMRLAWRIVGGPATFERYLIINCLYFGTFSVLSHMLLLCGHILSSIDRNVHLTGLNKTFALGLTLKALLYVLGFGALFVWCVICWKAYHEVNGPLISKAQSATAFILVSLISLLPLLFGALLREGLLGTLHSQKYETPR